MMLEVLTLRPALAAGLELHYYTTELLCYYATMLLRYSISRLLDFSTAAARRQQESSRRRLTPTTRTVLRRPAQRQRGVTRVEGECIGEWPPRPEFASWEAKTIFV